MAFRAPRGTYDLLPPAGEAFLAVREALVAPARLAGYGYVETPAFEDTELFARGVGASTDVVSKEMYSFTTRGDDHVSLRPEGTAGVLRAVLEAGLHHGPLPVKLWYSGSYYRYERPQAGRYRHFSQVGAEALGIDDPALDAELVWLAVQGYASLGLTGVRLLLNSLGDAACRPAYREVLTSFLRGLDLDEATRARIDLNPLRVLDDKRPEVQEQLRGAPEVGDHLCQPCRDHHASVVQHLADLGIAWEAAPRLVRGLDYYVRTAFEFVHDGLGAQSAVGGGGRYDGLAEQIGGPALPGVGWALGVDRTVLALAAEERSPAVAPRSQVFVVPLGAAARSQALQLVAALRRAGVPTDMSYGDRAVKGGMKAADRSGATYALIVGERDLAAGVAQLKDLRSAEQTAVPLLDAVEVVKGRLA
ncbi:MAG TPA: histidine--tRNA ligase [Mycobacteriales bacterium]|nr:histidine--tRNA ligase [Mycobacteriales bacterium]